MGPRKPALLLKIGLLAACVFSVARSDAQDSSNNPLQLLPHHATASVSDLDQEISWYERVLGFQQAERTKVGTDFEICHLTIPGYRIDLAWKKGSVRHREETGAGEQGWMHIVFKSPIIDEAFRKLSAEGTDVKADRNAQSAITRLIVHDPEGNEIEIVP